MSPVRVVLACEDYCEIPDDGKRYEIYEGLSGKAWAPPDHQTVSQ